MADIRKVIYKLGRDLTSQSFGEIGRKLNGRTYAAVWHGKVDYEDLMFVDPNVSKEYEKIKTLILPKL